jgi:phi13 family phage major tail protein
MSKVKFGLRGFEFGEVTAENKVPTTMKIPGIKSAKIDITNELITIAADDGPYVVLSSGITGTQLEVSVLDLPTEARKVLYGIEVKNGIEVYNKNLTPKDVACIFRTSTEDGKAIWIGLLKGKFSLPGMEAETKDGSPDPKPDTVTGNFVARGDNESGDVLVIGREDNTEFQLEKFKEMVFPK